MPQNVSVQYVWGPHIPIGFDGSITNSTVIKLKFDPGAFIDTLTVLIDGWSFRDSSFLKKIWQVLKVNFQNMRMKWYSVLISN